MPKELSVSLDGDLVEIKSQDGTDEQKLRMGVDEALSLAAHILVCVKDARNPQLSSNQEPLLWFRNPAIEVGADPQGDLVLAFRAFSLPLIAYSFDDEDARRILGGIQEVLRAPKDARYQSKMH